MFVTRDYLEKITTFRGFIEVRYKVTAVCPLLAAWTLALLILRMCRPHPSLRRLVRQPGFAACVAASTAILLGVLSDSFEMAFRIYPFRPWPFALLLVLRLGPLASSATAAVWAMMAVAGHWHRETDWIGWVGRILGIGWIVMLAFSQFSM